MRLGLFCQRPNTGHKPAQSLGHGLGIERPVRHADGAPVGMPKRRPRRHRNHVLADEPRAERHSVERRVDPHEAVERAVAAGRPDLNPAITPSPNTEAPSMIHLIGGALSLGGMWLCLHTRKSGAR